MLPGSFVNQCQTRFDFVELGAFGPNMSTQRLSSCDTLVQGCGVMESQAASQKLAQAEVQKAAIIAKIEAGSLGGITIQIRRLYLIKSI